MKIHRSSEELIHRGLSSLDKNPSQEDMLEDYKSPSVHCAKCNLDIGNITDDNCPNCGYDTTDSIAKWIEQNRKFEIK